jgi:hypothetical protein
VTQVDPDSLRLKLQFKPWVSHEEHQEAYFASPSTTAEQQRRQPKGAVPEQNIVLPPIPLSLSPAAQAAAKAEAEASAVATAAEVQQQQQQQGG